MTSHRRLVILGSGITALAVARSAQRLGMQPVIFDKQARIASACKYVQLEIHPQLVPDSLALRLAALGRECPSYLIATADEWLRFVLIHRTELESAYQRILHPENTTLSICLDKQKFATWCEARKLPIPRHYRLDQDAELNEHDLNFPLLLRPAETAHADTSRIKAVEVNSAAELAYRLEELNSAGLKPVLAESLLSRSLSQYSVGFARIDGQMLTVVARKLRPLPDACAPGTLVEAVEDRQANLLARRVADLLDYNGIGEIEILRDTVTGQDFLIEVNARPWLQFSLASATQRDLLAFIMRDKVNFGEQRQTRRVRWLDFRGDLRICFKPYRGLVRAGRLGLLKYLHSIGCANTFAYWSFADRRPFWRGVGELFRRPNRPDAPGPGKIRAPESVPLRHWRSLQRPDVDWKNSSGWE